MLLGETARKPVDVAATATAVTGVGGRLCRHRPQAQPAPASLEGTAPDLEMNECRGRSVSATGGSLVGGAGVRHVGGNDPRVELLGRQEAQLGGFSQRQAL